MRFAVARPPLTSLWLALSTSYSYSLRCSSPGRDTTAPASRSTPPTTIHPLLPPHATPPTSMGTSGTPLEYRY